MKVVNLKKLKTLFKVLQNFQNEQELETIVTIKVKIKQMK